MLNTYSPNDGSNVAICFLSYTSYILICPSVEPVKKIRLLKGLAEIESTGPWCFSNIILYFAEKGGYMCYSGGFEPNMSVAKTYLGGGLANMYLSM